MSGLDYSGEAMPSYFHTPPDPTLAFIVRGTPAPQGSKRHVGNGVMVESSKAVKPWREDVRHAAIDALNGRPPLEGPVAVTITFTLARPKSAPKSRVLPDVRPDLDKLARSSLDALKSAGVYTDDSKVCRLVVEKVYGIVPGAGFTITPISLNGPASALAAA